MTLEERYQIVAQWEQWRQELYHEQVYAFQSVLWMPEEEAARIAFENLQPPNPRPER